MHNYYDHLNAARQRWLDGELSDSEFFDELFNHITTEGRNHILATPRDMLWELRCAIRKREEEDKRYWYHIECKVDGVWEQMDCKVGQYHMPL